VKLIKLISLILITSATALFPRSSTALDYSYLFSGELSGWTLGALAQEEDTWSVGTRYIPALAVNTEGSSMIDLYVYLNAFAAASSVEDYDNYDLDLYRLVLRYTTNKTETRIGLQKITFGPAIVLRSLMWFDSIDPRDPQQLTEGIWALRFRYDALDNSSLWLWGIYPDSERKGLEVVPSEEGYPELGGRYVRPLFDGEMGVTFNSRQAEVPNTGIDFRENRFALDGKWDIEIGIWFEAVLQHQSEDFMPMQWQKMLSAGADYTFGVGNGLYFLLEHMGIFFSEETWGSDDEFQTTAWMASYSMGIMDHISAIGYYSWEVEKYYQYAAWQRTWDSWMLHISAFHYPETDVSFSPYQAGQPIMGTGGQVLVIFNH
jgi:hypothetical protein